MEITATRLDRRGVALTSALLACGAIAGPGFIGASLIQAVTRAGFDPTRHAISLLLLGDLGWVQRVNFVVTGLLVVAFAVGARRSSHPAGGGTWGPVLIGAYGVLLVVAGLATPDPAFGFPPGAADGVAATISTHAGLHSLAFFGVVLAATAASFVFARRFRAVRRRALATCCVVTGLGAPLLLLVGIGLSPGGDGGLPLLGVAVATSSWLTAVAIGLRR